MPHTARSTFASHAIHCDGDILTTADLPPRTLKRWVARRKAQVIAAIRGGLLTMAEAGERYGLSMEELLEWQRHYEAEGMRGLRATLRHTLH